MDNLETTGVSDPQGAADVTAASGQSDGTETQTVETTGTTDVSPAKTTETQNPWDTDDRFKGKTPDEMFKIVQEADKYKGQLSQKAKLADMLSRQYGLTPERMEQIAQEQAEATRAQEIERNPVGQVYEELQEVKQKLLIQEHDSKLDKYLQENPQYAEFRKEIRGLGYSVDRDKDWGQIAEKYFGRAIVKGQETAYKKIDEKVKTQTAGVSRAESKRTFSIEDLQNMSASELEKILPHSTEEHNRPY